MRIRITLAAVSIAIAVLALPGHALAAAPTATTDPVTITSATAATLNGFLQTGGLDTSYHFAYALSTDPFCTGGGTGGSPTLTGVQTLNGSQISSSVSAPVSGLTGGA